MRLRTLALGAILCAVTSVAAALTLMISILAGLPLTETTMWIVILLVAGASIAMMAFLALYVYTDAKSRGMNGVFWAFLVVVFAGFPGFVVYLLMRPHLRTS